MLTNKTLTLNEIIKIFSDIADAHSMINSFGAGPSYNIGVDRSMKFPYLWVEATTSNIVKSVNGFKELTYSFNVYVMDRISKGDSNYDEILSDTHYIISTIIQLLSQHPNYVEYNLSLSEDISLEPAYEVRDENSNGWVCSLTFKIPIRYTFCNSPIDTIPAAPLLPKYAYVIDGGTTYQLLLGETYSCEYGPADPVIVTDGDGVTYSIPAGGTFSCEISDPVDITDTYGVTYSIDPGGSFSCSPALPVEITDTYGDPYTIPSGDSFSCTPAFPVEVIDTYGATYFVPSADTFYCSPALPVVVTDTDSVTYSVVSGGTFSCTIPVCDPVIVTDTDSVTYSVASGGTFACTIPSSSSTVDFNFTTGNQYHTFHRVGFVGSLTAVTYSNISSYTLWINGVTQSSLPIAVNQDDRFYISITASSTASNALLRYTVSGITSTYSYSNKNYFYPRTTLFTEEVVRLNNEYVETDMVFYADDPTTNWYGNYIASTPLVDNFEVVIPPNTPLLPTGYSVFGLNDQTVNNTVAGRPNRTKYFFGLLPNVWQVYEFNVLKSQLSFANTACTWFKISGSVPSGATQGTVTFYRSTDNGSSWTLLYTSLTLYNAGTKFYYDFQHVGGANTWTRFVSSRLKQF